MPRTDRCSLRGRPCKCDATPTLNIALFRQSFLSPRHNCSRHLFFRTGPHFFFLYIILILISLYISLKNYFSRYIYICINNRIIRYFFCIDFYIDLRKIDAGTESRNGENERFHRPVNDTKPCSITIDRRNVGVIEEIGYRFPPNRIDTKTRYELRNKEIAVLV